ncbi:MAG: 3-dehydroquinate synthase, partial [Candidatus Cloacimonadota bacterium]|nr:3-dehydroquinate synthase [Candidatus Cloacimonadota bacterium]
MEKIYISEDIDSEIYLDGNLELLDFLVDKGNTIVLTDQNIFKNYTKELEGYQTIILEPGEQNKTLDTYQKIIRTLLKKNANRQTTLVGIGGGVISDLCGFVASTFMRG